MTFHTIQRIIWTIVKGLLTQMIVYSLPKSNRFYWELVPGPRHAKLCTERLFDWLNACGRFYWFLMPFERYITLKQRLNCRRTDVRSAYFLVLSSNFAILDELCDFWQIMQKFANYAKSQHRRISEALYKYCIFFSSVVGRTHCQVWRCSNTERHLAGRMCTLQGHIAGNSEYFVFVCFTCWFRFYQPKNSIGLKWICVAWS